MSFISRAWPRQPPPARLRLCDRLAPSSRSVWPGRMHRAGAESSREAPAKRYGDRLSDAARDRTSTTILGIACLNQLGLSTRPAASCRAGYFAHRFEPQCDGLHTRLIFSGPGVAPPGHRQLGGGHVQRACVQLGQTVVAPRQPSFLSASSPIALASENDIHLQIDTRT